MLSELIIMIPFYTLKITTRRVIDDQFLPNKKIKTASTVITTKYLFDLLLRSIHSAAEIKLPADKKNSILIYVSKSRRLGSGFAVNCINWEALSYG